MPIAIEADGEIDQVFSLCRVVNGLRCPYPFHIAKLLRIERGEVYHTVVPIGKIVRLQHHDAGIVFPSVLHDKHVCRHHVKTISISTAKDVRVADTSRLGNVLGTKNRPVVVQRIPVPCIRAIGKP